MRRLHCPSCGREKSVPDDCLHDETECAICGNRFRPAQLLNEFSDDCTAARPANPASDERTEALPPDRTSGEPAALPEAAAPTTETPPKAATKAIRLEDKMKAADPAAHDPLIETVLGKVHLKRRLGEGGMGAVYVGHHLTLDVDVAVKVLPPELARRHPAFVERFLREARTAAQIHHPNIVQVYDVDYERGFFYIVMEYVDGETAAERLRRRGRLGEREVVGIAMDAAAALEYARRKQIVHRDVKPENLLISKEGEVKLADLGLAKQVVDETKNGVTLDGQALGTPAFVAPEQVSNARQADHRSDLYSLGATLFYLATGRPPFQGSTALQTMMLHLNQPAPQLRAFRAELSVELAGIVHRLLGKEPDERYQTAAEVYHALSALYGRATPEGERDIPLNKTPINLPTPTPEPAVARKATSVWAVLPPADSHKSGPITHPTPVPPSASGSAHPQPQIARSRPSRWWMYLLFLPCLNWLAWLWIGVTARHAVWLGVGVGVLAAYTGFALFALEIDPATGLVDAMQGAGWLSWAGVASVYLGTLVCGFAVRREYELRVVEMQRDEEV